MWIRMKVDKFNRKLAERLAKAEAVTDRRFNKATQTLTVRVKQSFLNGWGSHALERLTLIGTVGTEKWYEWKVRSIDCGPVFKQTKERVMREYEADAEHERVDYRLDSEYGKEQINAA